MAESRKKKQDNPVNFEALGLEMGNRPPQALDVEEAVLASLLVEPNCVEDTMGELTVACFYSPKHKMIYEAMVRLVNDHVSIDPVTVTQQLRSEGNLEAIGGPAELARLSQNIGAAAHIEFYVKILKQKCIQRDLITAAYTILKDSYDESINVDKLIDTSQSLVYAAIQNNVKRDVQDIRAVINQAIADIQRLQDTSGLSGVPSGFISLDRVTFGWQPSDLIILAARPSVGKTAFAMNLARNAAVDHNMPVAFFSLEMPAIQLVKRMMVSETGLPAEKIKGGQKLENFEWVQLEQKIQNLSKAPLYIDDTPALPVMDFRSKAKRLVNQKGIKLIIVDYLQLMQPPQDLKAGIREQEVAAVSRTLKATAKELNVPIIALSQLSRTAVSRQGSNGRPQLNDLRESGSIEQDADMVIFIHRADYQAQSEDPAEEGKTTLIIAKHRNGEVKDIPLMFRKSEVRFVDEEENLMGQYEVSDGGVPEMGYVRAYDIANGRLSSDASDFPGGDDFGANPQFE